MGLGVDTLPWGGSVQFKGSKVLLLKLYFNIDTSREIQTH